MAKQNFSRDMDRRIADLAEERWNILTVGEKRAMRQYLWGVPDGAIDWPAMSQDAQAAIAETFRVDQKRAAWLSWFDSMLRAFALPGQLDYLVITESLRHANEARQFPDRQSAGEFARRFLNANDAWSPSARVISRGCHFFSGGGQ